MTPRTPELPMAFTWWEFIRGCLLTYGFFLLYSAGAWIWTLAGVLVAPIMVAPYGFASLILCGAPLAYLTGMLLRRELRTCVHLFWHGLVGLVAGGFGVFVALCIYDPSRLIGTPHLPDWGLLNGGWIVALIEALCTIGAAMTGWRITSRRALASDPWYAEPDGEDERLEDAVTAER